MKMKFALACAWVCLQAPGWAQSAITQPDGEAWRRANEAVGQHRRGHADILAKEPPLPEQAAMASSPLGLQQAMTLALRQRSDLWVEPAQNALETARANARVAQLSHQVQRAWIDAVAAGQSLTYRQDALAATEAGAELAYRMAVVGNWTQAQHLQVRLLQTGASLELSVARQQADGARERLARLLGLSGDVAHLALPARLPELPASPLPEQGIEASALSQNLALNLARANAERELGRVSRGDLADWQTELTSIEPDSLRPGSDDATALGTLVTRAPVLTTRQKALRHRLEELIQARTEAASRTSRVGSLAREAYSRYRAAYDQARQQRDQVVLWQTALQEDTQARYNGMLVSTWDHLNSASARIRSVNAALQAQRQFWLAHSDLLAILAGLDVDFSADLPSTAQDAASAKAGH
jgi:outer membrane protein TolC